MQMSQNFLGCDFQTSALRTERERGQQGKPPLYPHPRPLLNSHGGSVKPAVVAPNVRLVVLGAADRLSAFFVYIPYVVTR